ncbi:MAG: hypothetical protein ACM3ZC_05830 [Bacteroidota bacterium]
MRRILATLLVLSILLCVGCTRRLSMDPTGPEDTLVVGRIRFEARGFEDRSDYPSLNGLHESNMTLTFESAGAGTKCVMSSRAGGVFYKNHLEPGMYRLVKLSAKVTEGRAWIALNVTFKTTRFIFPVEAGKVTNLGGIYMTIDDKGGNDIFQEAAPDVFRNYLTANFPESEWYAREWIDMKY